MPAKKSKAKKNSKTGSIAPEIEAKLAGFPPAKRKNLLIKLALYELGETVQWQEKQLADLGLIDAPLRGEKAESDNDICDTHEELARRMMLHYQNPDKSSKLKITITKQAVSDWSKGKRLGSRPMPPKPIEGVRRRWSLRAWIAWFDENLWHEYRANAKQTNGAALDKMPIGELEEIAKRERLEHERWRIVKEMGGYVSVPVAERHAAGFSRLYHDQWKNRNEKTMVEAFAVKAQSLGLEPDVIATLKDFLVIEHQKFTDAVEAASEKFAGELAEKLKAESNDQA